MTTQTIATIVNDVCQLPYGLVVVAGPKKSGKTSTMLALESAVSKINRGRYFRIGAIPPEDTSIIRFIETFKPAFDSVESLREATDDDAISEHKRYKAWERNVKFGIFPMDAAGVFIDDLDQSPAGLSQIVIDMALTGTLTIVSVEADSAKEAVGIICECAALASSGTHSLLGDALQKIIVQKLSVDGERDKVELDFEVIDADTESFAAVLL